MRKKKKKPVKEEKKESRRMVQYPMWPAKLIRKNRILINPGQKGRNGKK